MITIILPGASLINKTWAEDLAASFKPEIESRILYWSWWEAPQGGGINLATESARFSPLLPTGPYAVLAKSIGTYLLVNLLPNLSPQPEKIILCGLPLHDLSPKDLKTYNALKTFSPGKIMVCQNSADPHGSFVEIKEFIGKINPDTIVVSKPGDTHDYPYSQSFKEFLFSSSSTPIPDCLPAR